MPTETTTQTTKETGLRFTLATGVVGFMICFAGIGYGTTVLFLGFFIMIFSMVVHFAIKRFL